MADSGFLPLTRSIRDPIHGTIYLSDEEIHIIDHRLFRRLHRIKQNGLLYYVFPSATHSRFEHSLGVLHVAHTAFHSLIRNSQVAKEKTDPAVIDREDASAGQAIRFDKLGDGLLTDLLRITRLAALVHDLGHGPFSHTFDSFAPKRSSLIEAIEETELGIDSLISYLQKEDRKDKEKKGKDYSRVDHEEMSCYLFAIIWKDISEREKLKFHHDEIEEIPRLVAATILGDPDIANGTKLAEHVRLLNDLVASAPVDADRMDYLERDSRSVGVTYGLYDRQRLMKSFLVYKSAEEAPNGESYLRLGIKRSGLRAVENFVQARFELFVQIYYHKTNRAVSFMLDRIAKLADDAGLDVTQLHPGLSLDELYEVLSDERFFRILLDEDANLRFDGIDDLVQIAKRIERRDLWKRIFEASKQENDLVYQELKESEGGDEIENDAIDPKATKGLGKGGRLLRRMGEKGVYQVDDEKEDGWLKASPMMNALKEEEEKISRIYFVGSDSHTKSELRKNARQISQDLDTDES